jgi:lysyl-tRNA synthetase class 2
MTCYKERAQLKTVIRSFFATNDYVEIDTPILVVMPGAEVHLDYFATSWFDHSNTGHQRYLRSSPEIHMKRALAQGLGKIFQIAPSFRNGGEFSNWHHPEFTMLEWYEVDASLAGLMQQTSDLVGAVAEAFHRPLAPIRTYSVGELFEEYTRLDPFAADFLDRARASKLTNINLSDDHESAFFKIMLDIIEPRLTELGACFIHGYPASTASLAAVENGRALRAELYLNGVEIANGFQELSGKDENRKRLNDIQQERRRIGKNLHELDHNFINSMGTLGACAGNAVGFDRLLAWALGHQDLNQIIPFRNDFQR